MALIKKLTFADIQTKEILYYDPEWKEQCFQFCQEQNIDRLPPLRSGNTVFLRDDAAQSFTEETLTPEHSIDGDQNIFAPELLERFREHPLQMVTTQAELSGVVHFSDYNKPIVSIYLYELFFSYEKALRAILVLQGFGNKELLEFLSYKASRARSKKSKKYFTDKIGKIKLRQSKNEKLPPLQTFDFRDLMEFCSYKQIARIDFSVNRLRNMIMHAHELVNMEDPTAEEYIYNFDSFEKFFDLVVELLHDYKKILNRLAFINRDESLLE